MWVAPTCRRTRKQSKTSKREEVQSGDGQDVRTTQNIAREFKMARQSSHRMMPQHKRAISEILFEGWLQFLSVVGFEVHIPLYLVGRVPAALREVFGPGIVPTVWPPSGVGGCFCRFRIVWDSLEKEERFPHHLRGRQRANFAFVLLLRHREE